jgi:N-acetyl-anhydromuramyl-L-alanine amidase AmpD
MLRRSAVLVADVCARYAIPIYKLSTAEVLAGVRGICGHADVTNAFRKGDHSDPGPHFPWDHYLELVRVASQAQGGDSAVDSSGWTLNLVDSA